MMRPASQPANPQDLLHCHELHQWYDILHSQQTRETISIATNRNNGKPRCTASTPAKISMFADMARANQLWLHPFPAMRQTSVLAHTSQDQHAC